MLTITDISGNKCFYFFYFLFHKGTIADSWHFWLHGEHFESESHWKEMWFLMAVLIQFSMLLCPSRPAQARPDIWDDDGTEEIWARLW